MILDRIDGEKMTDIYNKKIGSGKQPLPQLGECIGNGKHSLCSCIAIRQ